MNIGDVVALKSGGPNLTITNVVNENITLYWFHENSIYSETVPASSLKIVILRTPTIDLEEAVQKLIAGGLAGNQYTSFQKLIAVLKKKWKDDEVQ